MHSSGKKCRKLLFTWLLHKELVKNIDNACSKTSWVTAKTISCKYLAPARGETVCCG